MTTADTKRIERIARESADLARESLRKSNEIEAYLSVVEYRAGKVRRHKSVPDLFRAWIYMVRFAMRSRLWD
jgi:hypothetical protein